MKSILISIVVPCYNVEAYIYKALESVLNQTYPHWECIAVNDGSLDKTETEIKNWVQRDSRFKLISQENKGVSATRNTGLKHVKGDCIFFLDPDDLLAPFCLENLLNLYDETIDIVIGKNAEVYGQTATIVKYMEHGAVINKVLSHLNFVELVLKNPITVVVWNKLYRADFIFSNNLTFKEGIVHEDQLWFFEAMHLAEHIIFNSDVTYYYNIRNLNSITKNYSLENLKCYFVVIETIYQKYYITELNNQKKKILATYILNLQLEVMSSFFRFLKKNKEVAYKSEGEELIKEHIKKNKIKEFVEISRNKTKQFELFIKYGEMNPEVAFKLIRNTYKKSILKQFETIYLKYLLNSKLKGN